MATVSSFFFSTAPKASAKALASIKQTDAVLKQEQAIKDRKEPVRPDSPVRLMLDKQKAEAAEKVNYEETEDFLRLKAFEIKNRITLYKNLGMTAQYQQAQQEGAAVVQKYQELLKSGKLERNDKFNTVDTSA